MNLAVKLIGKGLGSIALAIAASLFAVYALKHFPGWAIALSLVLLVCASVPAVLFFNLFPSADAPPTKSYVIEDDPTDDWNDLFSHWKDDDDRFDD
ncbi:hypothetical protein D3C84_292200 [compost metagenome]